MKIAVAQLNSEGGKIQKNIEGHIQLIKMAVEAKADLIVFPELSISGYEPAMAKKLATTIEDNRFEIFRQISKNNQIIIGAGMPLKHNGSIRISMMLFHPDETIRVYSKQFLHADEMPYFMAARSNSDILENPKIPFSICYELSVPQHAADAHKNRADIYINSSVKSRNGIKAAIDRLSEIARQYSMMVYFANAVGYSEGKANAGNSSVWDRNGNLLAQLDERREGLLIMDSETREINGIYLKEKKFPI